MGTTASIVIMLFFPEAESNEGVLEVWQASVIKGEEFVMMQKKCRSKIIKSKLVWRDKQDVR